jgi:hypothetical protein
VVAAVCVLVMALDAVSGAVAAVGVGVGGCDVVFVRGVSSRKGRGWGVG